MEWLATYGCRQLRGGWIITEQHVVYAPDINNAYKVATRDCPRGESLMYVDPFKVAAWSTHKPDSKNSNIATSRTLGWDCLLNNSYSPWSTDLIECPISVIHHETSIRHHCRSIPTDHVHLYWCSHCVCLHVWIDVWSFCSWTQRHIMRPNTRAIMEECIERGIETALRNDDQAPEHWKALAHHLDREIWLHLDSFFNFDDSYQWHRHGLIKPMKLHWVPGLRLLLLPILSGLHGLLLSCPWTQVTLYWT